ncbi:hypothetical protein GCM10010345_20000 [Streptomyces canarius]|uniref:NAD-dependent epimerase/dehydratase domain-containing protein n=1 Tax=Streptomyces canarius TaxID=285453 RepID=A0ABQ3CHB8_9ACTN|nr:hypothetical protein GCM10010345_20000 [Streptomyces canarius]
MPITAAVTPPNAMSHGVLEECPHLAGCPRADNLLVPPTVRLNSFTRPAQPWRPNPAIRQRVVGQLGFVPSRDWARLVGTVAAAVRHRQSAARVGPARRLRPIRVQEDASALRRAGRLPAEQLRAVFNLWSGEHVRRPG